MLLQWSKFVEGTCERLRRTIKTFHFWNEYSMAHLLRNIWPEKRVSLPGCLLDLSVWYRSNHRLILFLSRSDCSFAKLLEVMLTVERIIIHLFVSSRVKSSFDEFGYDSAWIYERNKVRWEHGIAHLKNDLTRLRAARIVCLELRTRLLHGFLQDAVVRKKFDSRSCIIWRV